MMRKKRSGRMLQKTLLLCLCGLSWLALMGAKGGRAGCIGYSFQECTPGATQACYTGLPFTRGKGLCKDGEQTCTDDATWGPCNGEVTPKESDECSGEDRNCDGVAESKTNQEVCNGIDDNCDGKVDDTADICPAGQSCQGASGCQEGSTTPQPQPLVTRKGPFQDGDHPTSGEGRIIKEGEKFYVELSDDFKTDSGPGLEVYLVEDQYGKVTDSNFLNLGKLTSTTGKQRYEITLPAGKTLEQYKAISIWCKPFQVLFGHATLQ